MAACPEEDEGKRGRMARERRGGGTGPGSGEVGWAGKEKEQEIHSKMISRFRKMNMEIWVTEIILKNPKNS
jgi:hypothetical protein